MRRFPKNFLILWKKCYGFLYFDNSFEMKYSALALLTPINPLVWSESSTSFERRHWGRDHIQLHIKVGWIGFSLRIYLTDPAWRLLPILLWGPGTLFFASADIITTKKQGVQLTEQNGKENPSQPTFIWSWIWSCHQWKEVSELRVLKKSCS